MNEKKLAWCYECKCMFSKHVQADHKDHNFNYLDKKEIKKLIVEELSKGSYEDDQAYTLWLAKLGWIGLRGIKPITKEDLIKSGKNPDYLFDE